MYIGATCRPLTAEPTSHLVRRVALIKPSLVTVRVGPDALGLSTTLSTVFE